MATKSIAWNTGSGNITLTYAGQGDGPISIQSDANNGGARSQVITVETVGGAITRNFTVNQAACSFPVNTTKSYSYTGSYQEVELPAGQYKLQCWGAQGGSNGTNSSYSITAKAGGKGGYSEGVITLSQKTTVRVYVGGQGSSSSGGYNGGGGTSGTSQYSYGGTLGYSKFGGGGGGTDIRLSDGSLYSRMIVAGGGGGGAMCYKAVTTTVLSGTWILAQTGSYKYYAKSGTAYNANSGLVLGKTYKISFSPNTSSVYVDLTWRSSSGGWIAESTYSNNSTITIESKSGASYVSLYIRGPQSLSDSETFSVTVTETATSTESQVGGVGGGTQGGGYASDCVGKQNAAGVGGSFGQGGTQSATTRRYCSGAGGGGWYGGGGGYSDTTMTDCKKAGGGSGFVNTAASAGNRPSGYTGLELDSGETKAGNTSFPNTAGTGNETGHSGNGYAKITRLS